MRIAVLGIGYVGCVTSAGLAQAGHYVVAVDSSPEKVADLNDGRSPIVEPGLAERIAGNRQAGRLTATTDAQAALQEVELVIVCVGTPSDESGRLDLRYVERVAVQIGEAVRDRLTPLTVVLRSTVLPGTTQGVFEPLIAEHSGKQAGRDYTVLFCPEFLRESSALSDFAHPPFTVVGTEDPAHAAPLTDLFSFLEAPVHVVETGVAESLKYASNAFHALKIGFANEIARVCHASDVDPRDVMKLFVEDRMLNISHRYLRPGFAFGGSCLPKDVRALNAHAADKGVTVPVLSALLPSNDSHIDSVLDVVKAMGVRRIAQMGLTFKPDTDDMRESPFLSLAARLHDAGYEIKVYDPLIDPQRLVGANRAYVEGALPALDSVLAADPASCLDGAELVLLSTPQVDVCEAVLGVPGVPVVDLNGMLPESIERRFRARPDVDGNPGYQGVSW